MREKFGRWEVLGEGTSRFSKDGKEIKYCICQCQCGTVREVQLNSLKRGASKSCGCLQREVAAEVQFKHGESFSRLYRIHGAMKSRCTHASRSDFPHYGGRGITYAPEWEDYETFRDWSLANGYEDHLTLDRIDNNGNYEPNNCRWATVEEQRCNMSSNLRINWAGKEMCLSEWARELGIDYNTLRARIKTYGWRTEEAFTERVKA